MKIIKKTICSNKIYYLIEDKDIFFEVVVVNNEVTSIGIEDDIQLEISEIDSSFVDKVKELISQET